jgi:hypothetical protein
MDSRAQRRMLALSFTARITIRVPIAVAASDLLIKIDAIAKIGKVESAMAIRSPTDKFDARRPTNSTTCSLTRLSAWIGRAEQQEIEDEHGATSTGAIGAETAARQ